MAVPKKRTSLSKKKIRKNLWRKENAYSEARKAISFSKSISKKIDLIVKNWLS
jgi:ribosomal protein L32|uniref:Ribosomal protein L32 n=1 Tax=Drosera rotundifolia TaxID=173423 RepID=A0A140E9V9_DRORT|nr:ribosomal protein L32 [Drosera rotundifolia]YP_009241312.1 ribosomal protein L32 [Drosera rotundifolia]YP_010737217.1 ribosomal protein L32 [Drosera capensis]YP_010737256.1 ribosomal protein L32 [Drosera capensis]AMK97296.1 ribosomal protein L32 [Drosera rotundifolia]AMK97322.1 ribosomal protein L32 [Drosera rotundifolia]WEQ03476.1 ribosomal protein L32 [Drosera capensis]WEQ03515.1 ribosomal protein L32 [Drosera capensis]